MATNMSAPMISDRKSRVLLGITGSVAAIKGPKLCLDLMNLGMDVQVVLTQGGAHFWNKSEDYDHASWMALQSRIQARQLIVYFPDDEWKGWNKMGDPVLHIQLRDWADIALVAPLSAHTLAKIAGGLCDDTLTCILRAWDFRPTDEQHITSTNSKPILLAPAMNTAMWNHPLTQQQFQIIQSFSASGTSIVKVLPPVVKTLACGDIGTGAMADLADITIEVMNQLSCKGRRDASS